MSERAFHSIDLPSQRAGSPGEDPQVALRRVFGHDSFRGVQKPAIEALLAGIDVLGLMPTGGGKSLCYQVPALVLPGIALVVSPLLALMRDQVDGLRRRGVRAAAVAGEESQSIEERREILGLAAAGALDILYLSPERLGTVGFQNLLHQLQVSLVAIDEAHCVCEWGRDFRPAYMELPQHLATVNAPRIALTASATPAMTTEIKDRLLRGTVRELRRSFDRPNITINARRVVEPLADLDRLVKEHPVNGSTIVYLPTRQGTEEAAKLLSPDGLSAAAYHAGLPDDERKRVQDGFLAGEIPTICATTAFGMGVDHPNTRRVVYVGIPASIIDYYQGIGRAGRDGLPSESHLLWSDADVARRARLAISLEGEARRREVGRMETVLGLAHTPGCRRATLLRCFGEDTPEPCGNCDLCLSSPARIERGDLARAAVRLAGRLGEDSSVSILNETLLATPSSRIRSKRLDSLPEYGFGKRLRIQDCRPLIRQIVGLGYLEVSETTGAVLPTAAGKAQLRSSEAIYLVDHVKEAIRTSRGAGDRRDVYWQEILIARDECAKQLSTEPARLLDEKTALKLVAAVDSDEDSRMLLSQLPTSLIGAIEDARLRNAKRRDMPAAISLSLF